MMAHNRKEFIKKACISGACLCGFSAVLTGEPDVIQEPVNDKKQIFFQAYLAKLLSNIDETLSQHQKREIIKSCAKSHYEYLGMDEVLKPYIGNINSFISFLQKEWGWKVDYNTSTGTIMADENKDYCVCPMINKEKGISNAICFCSEGFAELMFTAVMQKKVSANVISSIQRGDKRCIYKITEV